MNKPCKTNCSTQASINFWYFKNVLTKIFLWVLDIWRKDSTQNIVRGDFPGGLVAKTLCFQCRGPGSFPGQGTRSHMLQLRPSSAR